MNEITLQHYDRAGRVIYAGTFSKLLYPSLRIGYLVLPDAVVAKRRKEHRVPGLAPAR